MEKVIGQTNYSTYLAHLWFMKKESAWDAVARSLLARPREPRIGNAELDLRLMMEAEIEQQQELMFKGFQAHCMEHITQRINFARLAEVWINANLPVDIPVKCG